MEVNGKLAVPYGYLACTAHIQGGSLHDRTRRVDDVNAVIDLSQLGKRHWIRGLGLVRGTPMEDQTLHLERNDLRLKVEVNQSLQSCSNIFIILWHYYVEYMG